MFSSLIRTVLIKNIPNKINNLVQTKNFHTTSTCCTFWESSEKSGYTDNRKKPPATELIRNGFKELKQEIALWSQEVKEHFESDPILIFRPGETDVVWNFGTPDSLDKWVVTSDSDNNEGQSSCSLQLNKQGKGVFSGVLSTRIPLDGRVKRAGYCNIRTVRARVNLIFSILRFEFKT